MDQVLYILGIGYLGFTVYYANTQQRDMFTTADIKRTPLRWLLYLAGGITGLLAINLLLLAIIPAESLAESEADVVEIALGDALFGITLAVIATFLIFYLIASPRARQLVTYLTSPGRRYNPTSLVHLTALVLSILLITQMVLTFILIGGSDAMAQEMENVDFAQGILQNIVWIAIAFLGVGFAIRRRELSTVARLGLRTPTTDDWVWGLGTGFGIYVASGFIAMFILLFTPDAGTEASAEQVKALASLNLPLMLILLTAVAIGEELFFRGALQPVFGNGLTTVFFVSLHIQSLFDPLILGLVAVSLAFGWLRDRYSTTAAILAHLVYNLIIILLSLSQASG